MLKSIAWVLFLSVCLAQTPIYAQDAPAAPAPAAPPAAAPSQAAPTGPTQSSTPTERDISIDDDYRITLVSEPAQRLTTNWAFVVDNSHSTWNIGARILKGFQAALQYPTDHLRFCSYVFHDRGVHKYRNWVWASEQEFVATERWITQNHGVLSYAGGAIRDALHQEVAELTIIVISDGGFSEEGPAIKRIIAEGQQWRIDNGFGRAIICCVGIENMLGPNSRPRPYPKPANETCQQWMRDIGEEGQGGYIYVQPSNSRNNHGTQSPTRTTARRPRRVD